MKEGSNCSTDLGTAPGQFSFRSLLTCPGKNEMIDSCLSNLFKPNYYPRYIKRILSFLWKPMVNSVTFLPPCWDSERAGYREEGNLLINKYISASLHLTQLKLSGKVQPKRSSGIQITSLGWNIPIPGCKVQPPWESLTQEIQAPEKIVSFVSWYWQCVGDNPNVAFMGLGFTGVSDWRKTTTWREWFYPRDLGLKRRKGPLQLNNPLVHQREI